MIKSNGYITHERAIAPQKTPATELSQNRFGLISQQTVKTPTVHKCHVLQAIRICAQVVCCFSYFPNYPDLLTSELECVFVVCLWNNNWDSAQCFFILISFSFKTEESKKSSHTTNNSDIHSVTSVYPQARFTFVHDHTSLSGPQFLQKTKAFLAFNQMNDRTAKSVNRQQIQGHKKRYSTCLGVANFWCTKCTMHLCFSVYRQFYRTLASFLQNWSTTDSKHIKKTTQLNNLLLF